MKKLAVLLLTLCLFITASITSFAAIQSSYKNPSKVKLQNTNVSVEDNQTQIVEELSKYVLQEKDGTLILNIPDDFEKKINKDIEKQIKLSMNRVNNIIEKQKIKIDVLKFNFIDENNLLIIGYYNDKNILAMNCVKVCLLPELTSNVKDDDNKLDKIDNSLNNSEIVPNDITPVVAYVDAYVTLTSSGILYYNGDVTADYPINAQLTMSLLWALGSSWQQVATQKPYYGTGTAIYTPLYLYLDKTIGSYMSRNYYVLSAPGHAEVIGTMYSSQIHIWP